MPSLEFPEIEPTYVICRTNENTIFHYGDIWCVNVIKTGLDILESFTVEQEFIDRLDELNVVLEVDDNGDPIYHGVYRV